MIIYSLSTYTQSEYNEIVFCMLSDITKNSKYDKNLKLNINVRTIIMIRNIKISYDNIIIM
jgi:hypothetical protein